MTTATILETNHTDNWYFQPRRSEIITILLTGIAAGILLTGLSYLIDHFLLQTFFCRNSGVGLCADTQTLAFNISLGLTVLASVSWLATRRIFRPALVVLPIAVILWSLPANSVLLTLSSHVFEFGLTVTLVSAAAMLVYYWIVRIQSFFIVALLWVMLTLALRWFVVS